MVLDLVETSGFVLPTAARQAFAVGGGVRPDHAALPLAFGAWLLIAVASRDDPRSNRPDGCDPATSACPQT